VSISIVVPIFNEQENVPRLHQQLTAVLPDLEGPYEIVFVDDGSTDGSGEALRQIAQRDPHVVVVQFRRNFGQTQALQAGIDTARYDRIVTLDGDLQNDPADIPRMLAYLDRGFDLVHGWRRDRQDALLNRKLPSRIANALISRTTGFPIHDLGCTLKAMRREVAVELELFGEMHRFIPILAHRRGAKCVELEVLHHPRIYGQTKYGIGRVTRVLLDLVTVVFLLRYLDRPMRFFGKLGFACGLVSFVSGVTTLLMKGIYAVDMTGNPLLLQAVFSAMLCAQFISLGLLSEVAVRTYFTAAGRRGYAIRQVVTSATSSADPARMAA
jgi:glycosyltransferase involved in cell wall biosynthesis